MSLLQNPGYVTTDPNGNFSITGDYTCPTGAYVYLLALGGNPGSAAGTNNPRLALAAGLGPCSSLSASSFFTINEVSTVAAAYSLSNFAVSDLAIGAADPGSYSFTSAYGNIGNLIHPVSGVALALTPTGNGIVPRAKIDTLADILAACVNSNGTGGPCSSLMADANVSGANGTPVDTFQAVLNIAHNPTANVSAIYGLAPSSAPFQPTLSSPPSDWTITIQYPSSPTASVSPESASLAQGGQQGFNASVNGAASGSFSYLWTTSAQAGSLNEVGGAGQVNQHSYCSASAQALYVSNASPALAGNVDDTVTVQAFTGTGCVAAQAISIPAVAPVVVTPPAASLPVPGFPTTLQTATVVLPPGSPLRPDQLTVLDPVGQVSPAPSGTFTLPTYIYDSQIVTVLTQSGNPMMLGWLDPTHQVVSAGTTAEVLAYVALGGPLMYTTADREALEAAILNAPGLPALTQAITTEIAANPDVLLQTDANIQTALNAFFTSVSGIVPLLTRGGVHALGVGPKPDGSAPGPGATGILIQPGEQSGVFVEQASGANDADTVNKYRRRTHVFVQRISDTSSAGVVTGDPADITDYELSPTTGLSGGVAGTVADIYNFYWGNTTTAYGPVTSDPFSIPVTAGSARTTYQVTVVGAGAPSATFSGLPANQATAQLQVAIGGFVTDSLIPFLSNYIFGSGFFSSESGALSFQSNWQADLQNDFLSFVSGLPTLQTQIMTGDYKGALGQIIDNLRQSGSFRNVIVASLQQASGGSFAASTLKGAVQSINVILNAAGGVLQIYDSSIMASQLLMSDAADQWTIINGGQKVTLTPATTTLQQFGTGVQTLTAALPGVSDTTSYSYYWTNTASVGNLAPADGSGGASAGFCSNDNAVTYTVHPSPILQQSVTDKIFVQAFSSGACRAASLVGTSPTAAITVSPDAVTLSPQTSTIQQSGNVPLTAAVTNGGTATFSYQYTLFGALGAAPVGTLADGMGKSGLSFCSNSTQVTYTPNASPMLTQNASDGVTVQAFTGAGCVSANSLGTSSSAAISVTALGLLLQPRNPRVEQNGQQTLTATLQLPSGNAASGSYSYQWALASSTGSATLGVLQEEGGQGQAGASFCSTSNMANYAPNTTPILTQPGTDVVTVQAFSGTGCITANAASTAVSTSVTVTPAPTISNIPFTVQINSVMEASDGNYYVSDQGTPGGTCTPSGSSGISCGEIYQVTQEGVQTKIFQFPSDGSDGYGPGPLYEGPDGLLYGLTAEGTFFNLSFTGKFTALTSIGTGTNSAQPYSQHLLLGSDGFFYDVAVFPMSTIGLSNGLFPSTTTIIRISTQGVVTTPYTVNSYGGSCAGDRSSPIIIDDLLEGADGNFYAFLSQDCYYFSPDNGGALVQISHSGVQTLVAIGPYAATLSNLGTAFRQGFVQGADGGFYFVGFGYSAHEDVIRASLGGQFSSIYQLFNPGGPYLLENGLEAASDGNFYGSGAIASTVGLFSAVAPCSSTGAGCFYKYQVTPTGGYSTLHYFNGGFEGIYPDLADGVRPTEPGIQNDSGDLVGFTGGDYQNDPPVATIYQINNGLPPPIQLTFSQATTLVNQPVTLSWHVLNGFSQTAAACYAFVQDEEPGAGLWTGKQYGTISSTGFAGSTTIKPTAAGTYTYALTCAGRESGFATLVVH